MTNFDIKLFTYLSLAFIIAVIIGTLSHEFGHYLVAECLGYNASISYGSTHIENYHSVSSFHRFLITFGGPFETILTGTIGFSLILKYRKFFSANRELTLTGWILIFIALFWLRQFFNFLSGLLGFLQKGRFSSRSDESKLDLFLQLPNGTFITISALFATIVLLTIIFKFIPKFQRYTFILSGIIGGFSGYYLWLHSLGKILLP